MVCFSPLRFDVWQAFRALALCQSRQVEIRQPIVTQLTRPALTRYTHTPVTLPVSHKLNSPTTTNNSEMA